MSFTMYKRIPEKITTDVLVIGAGLAGVCAAVNAARNGCDVVLLERFRTLGGNGGPEVGVHPSGAHRFHPFAAETGLMEEMIEEAAWRGAKTRSYGNHYNISQMWDTVLSDTLKAAGVTVLRCHYAKTPVVENGKISKVIVEDIATFHTREITVKVAVVDASGDGNISALAGAKYRFGREGRETYGERSAPEVADDITLGTSLVAYVRKNDKKVDFITPEGTPPYHPGYEHTDMPDNDEPAFIFPTETGGEAGVDSIEDEHEIYETLLGQLYSWFEHKRNLRPDGENWELLWVSPRTGKRESRRFIGPYTLTQTDVESGKVFDDAIGFGGFPEDLHYPREENEKYIKINYVAIPPLYTIPYRSVYSSDIDNLFFASRLCSVSHMAHGTVRLQRTLSTIGMAVGIAAGLCKKYDCTPNDIYTEHLEELQQTMLKQDISIMGKKNTDKNDLALKSTASADSFLQFGVAETKDFIPLDKPRGVMLWDWKERLDTFLCYLKNDNPHPVTLTAVLKVYVPEHKYKFEKDQCLKFSYRKGKGNHVEWGVDDSCERFSEIKKVEFTVAADFCGWCEIPFDAVLGEKCPYDDDVRYLVELDKADGIYWSVSSKQYDFCRRFELCDKDDKYTTYYDAHSFNITPTPDYCEPKNVINGICRRWSTNPVYMWRSENKLPQSIELEWQSAIEFNTVSITFDSLTHSYVNMPLDCAEKVSQLLVKHYTVEAFTQGKWQTVYEKDNNYHRFNSITFDRVSAQKLRVNVLETWGTPDARIYEIRVYNN